MKRPPQKKYTLGRVVLGVLVFFSASPGYISCLHLYCGIFVCTEYGGYIAFNLGHNLYFVLPNLHFSPGSDTRLRSTTPYKVLCLTGHFVSTLCPRLKAIYSPYSAQTKIPQYKCRHDIYPGLAEKKTQPKNQAQKNT